MNKGDCQEQGERGSESVKQVDLQGVDRGMGHSVGGISGRMSEALCFYSST